ncbi:hypothetical protein BDA96_07G087700 [Sorghum bicolor]|uniref:Uncharacterized protein n=1 Tax=Sorghum bicolor TaxID=4558 RepID=A0A921QM10_SORBI|nr:hypothetical protein BDA96_07G087700 [Sorghum bicolor]
MFQRMSVNTIWSRWLFCCLMSHHIVMGRGIIVVFHNNPMREDCSGPYGAALGSLQFASQSQVSSMQEDHISFSSWVVTCTEPVICIDLMMVHGTLATLRIRISPKDECWFDLWSTSTRLLSRFVTVYQYAGYVMSLMCALILR